jgi:hypothetical protein
MRKVFVRLTPTAREALIQRALNERRHPADQAALMLEQALAQATPKMQEAAVTT